MDFSNIETFLVIASSKSISDAADKLFITQSTASHRLQALEMELGTSLLVRQKGTDACRKTVYRPCRTVDFAMEKDPAFKRT